MAVQKALESAKKRNFTETVELAINLKDVDLTIPKNRITEDIILPNGRGKAVKICVIGGGELALKAKDVADIVITPEELGAIATRNRLRRSRTAPTTSSPRRLSWPSSVRGSVPFSVPAERCRSPSPPEQIRPR